MGCMDRQRNEAVIMVKPFSTSSKPIPVNVVGGTKFGRYDYISNEQTWNMIISNEKLVPYAGYKKITNILGAQEGRGLFNSVNLGKLIAVIDNSIYVMDFMDLETLSISKIGTIKTFSGDVSIDENNAKQIAICDQRNIYIYDWNNSTLTQVDTDFTPNFVCFHNGYFIATTASSNQWRISLPNNGLSWPAIQSDSTNVGSIQAKPNYGVAVARIPTQRNTVFIFGTTETEAWTDTGAQLFPYQPSTYFNIDYGCISSSTVASNGNMVVWLGKNEKSGIKLLVSSGGPPTPISNDGLDFKFANLTNPSDSYGFLFEQDGHVIYQFTFVTDNQSYIYDFNTKEFFNVSNELQNYHIAKETVFFNRRYYFISFKDGNIYQSNSNYSSYNYGDNENLIVPRFRITETYREPDNSIILNRTLNLTIDQGNAENPQYVDLRISKDGGVSFSNPSRKVLNSLGDREGMCRWFQLPRGNQLTFMFRFISLDRFVVGNALMSYNQ